MDSPSPRPGWSRLDALLDEALELPLDRRRALLERIGARRPRPSRSGSNSCSRPTPTPATSWTTARRPGCAARRRRRHSAATAEGALDARCACRSVSRARRASGAAAWASSIAPSAPTASSCRPSRSSSCGAASTATTRPCASAASGRSSPGSNHPSIARLLDGGLHTDGRPYFAMELVDGEPITTSCDRQGLSIDDTGAAVLPGVRGRAVRARPAHRPSRPEAGEHLRHRRPAT